MRWSYRDKNFKYNCKFKEKEQEKLINFAKSNNNKEKNYNNKWKKRNKFKFKGLKDKCCPRWKLKKQKYFKKKWVNNK